MTELNCLPLPSQLVFNLHIFFKEIYYFYSDCYNKINKAWYIRTWQSTGTQPGRGKRLGVLKQQKRHRFALAFPADLSHPLERGEEWFIPTCPPCHRLWEIWEAEGVRDQNGRNSELHLKRSVLFFSYLAYSYPFDSILKHSPELLSKGSKFLSYVIEAEG